MAPPPHRHSDGHPRCRLSRSPGFFFRDNRPIRQRRRAPFPEHSVGPGVFTHRRDERRALLRSSFAGPAGKLWYFSGTMLPSISGSSSRITLRPSFEARPPRRLAGLGSLIASHISYIIDFCVLFKRIMYLNSIICLGLAEAWFENKEVRIMSLSPKVEVHKVHGSKMVNTITWSPQSNILRGGRYLDGLYENDVSHLHHSY